MKKKQCAVPTLNEKINKKHLRKNAPNHDGRKIDERWEVGVWPFPYDLVLFLDVTVLDLTKVMLVFMIPLSMPV